MDKEQELRPCPFCGGTNMMVLPRTCDQNTPYDPNDRGMPAVRCMTCYGEAVGKDWSGPETAVAAWNRRSSDEQAEPLAYMDETGRAFCIEDGAPIKAAFDAIPAPPVGKKLLPLYASPPAVAAGGVTEARAIVAEMVARNERNGFLTDWWCKKLDALTSALAVGDEGMREASKDTIDYVMRYGGRCRDCADENGTCPHSGLPCDTDAASKVIGFVLRAVDYGRRHGYLTTPPSRGEGV